MNDSQIEKIINLEKNRQLNNLELIASENIVSDDILKALGTILTNKYAEGYPHKRYYGGCEFVDQIESLAIERLKNLFQAEYVNVQPHSGSQANQAVFNAFLNPGDRVLSMSLSEGGHLTHGSSVNMSGKLYDFYHYSLKEDSTIDYANLAKMALDIKPKMIIAGGSAYSRIIDFQFFREVADSCGALLLVDMAHYAGLVASGLYPNPVPFADIVTSTTHKTLRGPRGGIVLCKNIYAKQIDKSIFPGLQGGPFMNVIAAKAIAFKEASTPQFKEYSKQVIINSQTLAKELQKYNFKIVTDGTDCHMFLIDLRNKSITGKEAEKILDRVGMTTNKNTIPADPLGPFTTSGLRVGTPAITTRGMKQNEMKIIALFIHKALENKDNHEALEDLKNKVSLFTQQFPLFQL